MKATIALAATLLLAPAGWPLHWHHKSASQSTSPASTDAGARSDGMADSSPRSAPSGSAPSAPVPDASSRSGPPAPAANLGSQYVPGPDYVIGLGDVLRISVWRESDLTSTVQVRSDGKISFPLLNDVQAVGYKPMDLAAYLTGKLKQYVDDPRVTVIVSQARPPFVYMVGEVGHKGPMAITPNMTVLQALVTAGLDTFANTKKIYILRVENGIEQKLPVNYKRMVTGKSTNQNIILKPGDMVVVP